MEARGGGSQELTERSQFRANFNGIRVPEQDERGVDGMRTGRGRSADAAGLRRGAEIAKRSQFVVNRPVMRGCGPAGRRNKANPFAGG
jgi:hypothetical protein